MARKQDKALIASKQQLATLKEQLHKGRQFMADAVPVTARKFLTPDRMTKIVLTAASRTPKLLACTPESILKAVVEIAELGLEPGGPMGHAYLVPFYNSRIGAHECVPIPGYRGYIELAFRSNRVLDIQSRVVRDGELFKVQLGTSSSITHEPNLESSESPLVAVYSIAHFLNPAAPNGVGGRHIEVMTFDQVEGIRKRSKAKDAGPWQTDFEEMAKKTVVRRARKYWPQSVEIASLASMDDRVDSGEYLDESQIVNATLNKASKSASDDLAKRLKSGDDDPDFEIDDEAKAAGKAAADKIPLPAFEDGEPPPQDDSDAPQI